jgi:hypothetical protein
MSTGVPPPPASTSSRQDEPWPLESGMARSRRRRGRVRRRVVLAGIMVAVFAAGGFLLYRQAAEDAFESGVAAQRAGDCEEASDRFSAVTSTFRFSFTGHGPAAERGIADCRAFSNAEELRAAGDFEAASGAFEALADEDPAGPLAAPAREEAAATYLEWGDDFRASRNYPATVQKYETVLQRFEDTSSARAAEERISDLHTTASNGLEPKSACRSLLILGAFLAHDVRVEQARRILPGAIYNCGLHDYQTGLYRTALEKYERLIEELPNHRLVPQAKSGRVNARVELLKTATHGDLDQPQRIGSAPSGTAVLVFINDSPTLVELLFGPPESRSIVGKECPECEIVPAEEKPAFCQEEGPRTEITLTPGEFDVAAAPAAGDTTDFRPTIGHWTLTSGSQYFFCFVLLEE